MLANKKYSEKLIRHAATTAEGHPCEILERLTYEQDVAEDGTLGEPRQVNQRFDLKTGQRVNHLGGDRFELDVGGEVLIRRNV
jgi:hypothetical protein